MTTLNALVAHYVRHRRDRSAAELSWFARQPTIAEAVSAAALAKGLNGKRLSHQRRIPNDALRESCRRLLACLPALQQSRSFEELHRFVASEINSVPGIGELTIYDIALHIGAKLDLEPNVVFLHAGTRVGAKRLGLDVSRAFLNLKDLPQALQSLRPREIEDLLCIYQDNLGPDSLSRPLLPADRDCGDHLPPVRGKPCC